MRERAVRTRREPLGVDLLLDEGEQLRRILHLIEDHWGRVNLQERTRVFPGSGSNIGRLQGNVAVLSAEQAL